MHRMFLVETNLFDVYLIDQVNIFLLLLFQTNGLAFDHMFGLYLWFPERVSAIRRLSDTVFTGGQEYDHKAGYYNLTLIPVNEGSF